MTKCFVGGVSGSGKTTLLTELQGRSDNCDVILGSRLLFLALGLRVGDYAALRAIPASVKDRVFSEVMQPLLDQADATGRNVLLDAHYLNFSKGTSRSVVFDWVGRMDTLVLIDTDAATIWGRIKSDENRVERIGEHGTLNRDLNGHLASIERSLEETRTEAKRLSVKYKKPLRTIDNSSDLHSALGMLSQVVDANLPAVARGAV